MINKTISHYKILEKLGEGGMGIVYKAFDTKLERTVALKLLRPETIGDPDAKKRFIREARAASKLNHPNISTIYEVDEWHGRDFISMEFVEGLTLKEKVKSGPPSIEEVHNIAVQVAEALREAHDHGIVHRDIKSENIMVTPKGQVKVMDFGLAKLKGMKTMTKMGTTMGTVAYMSPEQARGEEVDFRTDIWSFGVVLYEMITGQLPFKGDYEQAVIYSILNEEPKPLMDFKIDVPEQFQVLISLALKKDHNARFQHIDRVFNSLKKLKTSCVTGEVHVQKKLRTRKNRNLAALISSLVLFIIITISSILIFNRFKKEHPFRFDLNSPQKRLTSEPGNEAGVISPDGHYLAYINPAYNEFKLRDLETGIIKDLEPSGILGYYSKPTWSPDGHYIIIFGYDSTGGKFFTWSITGTLTNQFKAAPASHFVEWSPDTSRIVFVSVPTLEKCSVYIAQPDGKILKTLTFTRILIYPTWSNDSRYIAFVELKKSKTANIAILDTKTWTLSENLKTDRVFSQSWNAGGLSWSPDNRYLVYVGFQGNYQEFFALPINFQNLEASGPPIPISHFQEEIELIWPCLTADGRGLSFGKKQNNYDIYIAPIDIATAKISRDVRPVAIDLRKDYDPNWSSDAKNILFTSQRDGQPDLYKFSIETGETKRLTRTPINERNAQISPDGSVFSFSADGAIYSMPVSGGPAVRITPDSIQVLDCYTWSADSKSLYITVQDTAFNRICTLKELYLQSFSTKVLMRNIFTSCADIQLSPDNQYLAVSGTFQDSVQKSGNIKLSVLNLNTEKWTDLLAKAILFPWSKFSWTPDSRFILYDCYAEDNPFKIVPIDGGQIKYLNWDYSKFETNYDYYLIDKIDPTGKNILIMAQKVGTDMWMIGRN